MQSDPPPSAGSQSTNPSRATARALPLCEVVHEGEALRRMGGDRDVLLDVMRAFVENYPPNSSALHLAMKERDREALATAAHRIKGALAQIAALPAWQAAANVEQLSLQAPMSELKAAFNTLMRELERLLPALAAATSQLH